MPEVHSIDIADLVTQAMESGAYAEATRPNTLPTGLYKLTLRHYEGQENGEGQQWVRLQVGAERISKEKDPFSGRKGTAFFNATPNLYRRENGRLDKMTVLWGQMAKAFDIAPEDASAKAVLEAFTNYPLQGFITETLQGPEGMDPRYQRVEYLEDGAYSPATLALLDQGYVPQNYVQNLGKVKQ